MPANIAEDAFFIDHDLPDGLQLQLRQSVAAGILAGRLRVGDRLPSSRKLAKHLRISRITVTLAYHELIADGYLEARDRSGIFVAATAPVARLSATRKHATGTPIDWSGRLVRVHSDSPAVEKTPNWRDYKYPFVYGQADPDIFNHSAWRSCAHRALGRRDFHALANDAGAADDPELVDFIARHTLPRRGIAAGTDEILITMGAQNALWLVTQILLDRGKTAAMEDPGYPGTREVLRLSGCDVVNVPVDADGLPPEAIPPGTDVVLTTPSHQAPTTVTMPMARRRALLAAAAEQDFLVIEDDYEFELSFLKPPHPALKSLDTSGRVIYVGSFSKSLFPGLRLGYLVAPAPFVAEARHLRASVLRHPPGHIQRTTAYFLALGHYDALIRRMREAFQERHRLMMDKIATHRLNPVHASVFGGTSVWMKAPRGIDAAHLAARLRARDVLIEPGPAFFADPVSGRSHFRLGFSSIGTRRIPDGLTRLAQEINRM